MSADTGARAQNLLLCSTGLLERRVFAEWRAGENREGARPEANKQGPGQERRGEAGRAQVAWLAGASTRNAKPPEPGPDTDACLCGFKDEKCGHITC